MREQLFVCSLFFSCAVQAVCFRCGYTFQNRTYHGFHQALILACSSCGTVLYENTKPVFNEQETDETKEKIDQFANGLDDRIYAAKILNAADAIRKGEYPPEGSDFKYPAKLESCKKVIKAANIVSIDRVFLDFRGKWGITEVISSAGMRALFSNHHYGKQDLNDAGEISNIIKTASESYRTMALNEEVQALSKIKYRNSLRDAIYKLADKMAER